MPRGQLPIDQRRVALEVIHDGDRYGLYADADWESLIPTRGHGFVRVDGSYYYLSLHHQLHCLNSFRRIFNGQVSATAVPHAIHCLDYLRQAVLCKADTTLEPAHAARTTDGRVTQAAYGVGVTHECRDWTQVRDFVEGNWLTWKDEDAKYWEGATS